MNTLEMTLLVWLGSLLAGFFGALTGLGGGVVIVPLLTLVFGVDIRYAIGASLVSVIATSSGAAAAYVKEGFANLRIGILLEIATTCGALAGASLAAASVDAGRGDHVRRRAGGVGVSVEPASPPSPGSRAARPAGRSPAIGRRLSRRRRPGPLLRAARSRRVWPDVRRRRRFPGCSASAPAR